MKNLFFCIFLTCTTNLAFSADHVFKELILVSAEDFETAGDKLIEAIKDWISSLNGLNYELGEPVVGRTKADYCTKDNPIKRSSSFYLAKIEVSAIIPEAVLKERKLKKSISKIDGDLVTLSSDNDLHQKFSDAFNSYTISCLKWKKRLMNNGAIWASCNNSKMMPQIGDKTTDQGLLCLSKANIGDQILLGAASSAAPFAIEADSLTPLYNQLSKDIETAKDYGDYATVRKLTNNRLALIEKRTRLQSSWKSEMTSALIKTIQYKPKWVMGLKSFNISSEGTAYFVED